MSSQSSQWWPVALGQEISNEKPLGVSIGNEAIVLFRDKEGMVRALEDRCPHRRMPLSLGTVRTEGWLQCAYHGWSFDGSNGQCKAIPNLLAHEKVPSSYAVFCYRVAEQNGLIYVTADTEPLALPEIISPSQGRYFSGRQTIGLSSDDYIAALIDGPHLLLRCTGLRIAETMIADPHDEDGWLVMERAAFWWGQSSFDGFVREYKLIFRLAVLASTGEARISFNYPDGSVVTEAHFAITPSARGTTEIIWQSCLSTVASGKPALLRLLAQCGCAPISPQQNPKMAMVAKILVGPSEHWSREHKQLGLYGERLTTMRAQL